MTKKIIKKNTSKKIVPTKKKIVKLGKKEQIIKAFLVSIILLQGCIIVSSIYLSVITSINSNVKVLGANSNKIISKAAAYTSGKSELASGLKHRHDANTAYKAAGDALGFGADTSDAWSDCGRFVYAVMKNSGVDTSYPKAGAQTQLNYATASSKYWVYKNKPQSQVLAGDIIVVPAAHTAIAATDKATAVYQASWYTTVPNYRKNPSSWWKSTIYIIRLKVR